MSLLDVDNLSVRLPGESRTLVEGLSFSIDPGESVALAGESGSGKTQTALAIMGLSPSGSVVEGDIRFRDESLTDVTEARHREIRAGGMAMVFQDPSSALNPHLRVGRQMTLVLEEHGIASRAEAREKVLEMLARTGLPDPKRQAEAYPWQLSGGMRQRVMIASALITEPALLIADEPTTALDTTVQAQILDLIRSLQAETGVALLLVTHDFGVIANSSDRLLVIDGGKPVESGDTAAVLAAPTAAPTRRLLEASRLQKRFAEAPADAEPVLDARSVSVVYHDRPLGRIWHRQSLEAVHPTDLSLRRGETLAIVGESGCGKSSLARAILGLTPPASGKLFYCGKAIPTPLAQRDPASVAALQMVFQDPVGSLNPAWGLGRSVAEPLRGLAKAERQARVDTAFERVGLPAELQTRFPHQVSGGQAQRAALARALITQPDVLVCDEAVAALDAPTRQEILSLLVREQKEHGLSILFISHDLAVVSRLSHRLIVMYLGNVVESGPSEAVFARPRHPYTRALLDAMLSVDRPQGKIKLLPGEPPSPLSPPSGCAFNPRCGFAEDNCRELRPEPRPFAGELVACHRAEALDLATDV